MRRNDTALLLVLLLAALMRAVKWGLGAVVDLFLFARNEVVHVMSLCAVIPSGGENRRCAKAGN